MDLVAYNETGYRIGETHQRAKLSNATVDLIREYHEDHGRSYEWIARKLKLPYATVAKIARYERRAQTPDTWKRVDR